MADTNLKAQLQVMISSVGIENLRRVSAELDKTTGHVRKLHLAMGGGMSGGRSPVSAFNSLLSVASRFTTVAFGVARGARAIGEGFAGAMKPVIEFQSQMAQVQIRGSFTRKETEKLAEAAKDMGRTSIFTPLEGAQAQEALAASGLSPDQIMTNMPTVKKFAIAADLDTDEASNALVKIAGQFQMDLSDPKTFSRIGDSLVKAANVSTISVRELLQTMKYAGPIARMAGYDVSTTAAWAAVAGNSGLAGSQSGTGLRNMFSSFAKPKGGKFTDAILKKIGLSRKDVNNGLENIPAFLEMMEGRMERKGFKKQQRVALAASLFGQYGMTTAAVLQQAAGTHNTQALADLPKGAQLLNGLQQYAELIAGASGELERAYDIRLDTPMAKIEALNARWETLKISMGEKLLPHAEKGLDGLVVAIGNLERKVASDQFKKSMEGFGALIDAAGSAAARLAGGVEAVGNFVDGVSEKMYNAAHPFQPRGEAGERARDAADIPIAGPGIAPGQTAGDLSSWFGSWQPGMHEAFGTESSLRPVNKDGRSVLTPSQKAAIKASLTPGQTADLFGPSSGPGGQQPGPSVVEVKVSAENGTTAKIDRIKKGRVPLRANMNAR